MDRPQVFRVFVSSTFKDLAAERNLLQAEVFPRLREFCQSLRARFQPIDLRWGVSGEASLDQQAMNICLAEIRRCREVTPRPNFIVLLGNRRGWLAPPPQIPATEFEQIRDHVTVTHDRELLATWYARDDNAVPPEYCLRARAGELGRFRDQQKWEEEVEGPLGAILGKAASELDLPAADRLKYSASATEQEIEAGALAAGDASGHAFAFIRELTWPYPDPVKAAAGDPILEFADKDQAPLDALKSRLKAALPVKTYHAQWDAQLGRPTSGHLADLARDVEEALKGAILAQLTQLAEAPPQPGMITAHPALTAEGLAHRDFAEDRARIFVGRDDSLTAVARYLEDTDPRPLVITGEGGSGKSALLAEALCRAQLDHPSADLVYRFIGVTPDSSQGRALLRGLCLELARRGYGSAEATVPAAYPEPGHRFPAATRARWVRAAPDRVP